MSPESASTLVDEFSGRMPSVYHKILSYIASWLPKGHNAHMPVEASKYDSSSRALTRKAAGPEALDLSFTPLMKAYKHRLEPSFGLFCQAEEASHLDTVVQC